MQPPFTSRYHIPQALADQTTLREVTKRVGKLPFDIDTHHNHLDYVIRQLQREVSELNAEVCPPEILDFKRNYGLYIAKTIQFHTSILNHALSVLQAHRTGLNVLEISQFHGKACLEECEEMVADDYSSKPSQDALVASIAFDTLQEIFGKVCNLSTEFNQFWAVFKIRYEKMTRIEPKHNDYYSWLMIASIFHKNLDTLQLWVIK